MAPAGRHHLGRPGLGRPARGAGIDAVSYSGAESSVTVTLDGQANDGARGENDLVGDDVENVFGGDGPTGWWATGDPTSWSAARVATR